MIPEFNLEGLLPPGIHPCSWADFQKRFGTNSHRINLLEGFKRAVLALRRTGCERVYVDGSFVTSKIVPGDYDACWDRTNVDLNLLDPVLLDFSKGRAAMKAKYLGDWFPAQMLEGGSGKVFLEFFQKDKTTGNPKGIVMLETRGIL